MKNILWYLLAGSRGGPTRAKILYELHEKPRNANQLATDLKLDYKTIQHHLRTLLKHQLLTTLNQNNYGQVYFITPELESSWPDFTLIWAQFGSNLGKVK